MQIPGLISYAQLCVPAQVVPTAVAASIIFCFRGGEGIGRLCVRELEGRGFMISRGQGQGLRQN